MNATTPLGIAIPVQAAAGTPSLAEPLAAAPSVAPSVTPLAADVAAPAANATGGKLLSSLPLPDSAGGIWSNYIQVIAILCFMLAALWLLVWLLKKVRRGGFLASKVPAMTIESRLALGPKKWVMVARFLDRRLVLGVTDHQITLLTELGIDEDPKPAKQQFSSTLASMLNDGEKNPGESKPGKFSIDPAVPSEPQKQPGPAAAGTAPGASSASEPLSLSKS